MLSPFPVTAAFPTTTLPDVEGQTLTVLRRPYAFDVARVLTWVPPAVMAAEVLPGTPVNLSWGMSGGQDGLAGYVHAIRPVIEGTQQRTELIVTDAAGIMSAQGRRTYYNQASSNVVTDIVDGYRMYLEVDPTVDVHLTLKQEEYTDWDWMVVLAQTNDCVLLANQTTIMFRNLGLLWQENLQNVTKAGTYANIITPDARMQSFKPDYALTRTENDLYVQNFLFRPESWSVYFPYRATGVMTAPFGVRPLDQFQITEHTANRLWTVIEIEHVITSDGYVGNITFGGDGRNIGPTQYSGELLSVPQAMVFNARGQRPPAVLRDYSSVLNLASMTAPSVHARWEAARVAALSYGGTR